MGNLNIKLDISTEVKERGHKYRDFDIYMNVPENERDYHQVTDLDAIRTGLRNIFNWRPGERILNPEFGNTLYQYIAEPNNITTINAIQSDVSNMIARWEPRVQIIRVDVDSIPDEHFIHIHIYYKVPTLSDAVIGFNTIISNTVG